jgi:hypothetical protein
VQSEREICGRIRVCGEFLLDSGRNPQLGKLNLQKIETPDEARLEIGEVSLTAGIGQVKREVVFGVVTRNAAAGHKIGKGVAGSLRQFARFSKRKNTLRVKSHGKFGPKARLSLGYRKPEAVCHRFRNVETIPHTALYS